MCLFQLVRCPYYDLGCKIEILRKDYKTHLREESFNHSIIFIEGQKRKNSEIDELKHDIAHLRKDYDVEIKTMFLELNRLKNQFYYFKQNCKPQDSSPNKQYFFEMENDVQMQKDQNGNQFSGGQSPSSLVPAKPEERKLQELGDKGSSIHDHRGCMHVNNFIKN